VRKTVVAELCDGLINGFRTKITNAFVIDDASRKLRDVLMDCLVLAVDALALRCSGSALTAQAHASRATVVLKLRRRRDA
jgi:hypothetical protein